MQPIGIDLGNGAVKVRLETTRLILPNVTAVGRERADLGETPSPLDALDVVLDSPLVRRGARYHAGKLAAMQGTLATYMSPNDQKSASQQSAVMYVVSAATAILKNLEAHGFQLPQEVHAELYAVSGVSLVESLQPGIRKEFQNRLEGQHQVTFMPPSRWADLHVVLDIHARVFSEGHAAFLWLINNVPEARVSQSFLTGMVEIGELSTEFPVFEGQNLSPELSSGRQFGAGLVIDELLNDIRQFTGVHGAFRGGRIELEAFLERSIRTVELGGHSFDLKEVVDHRLMEAAKTLYGMIVEKWESVPSIKKMWLAGGGAALLKPYLQEVAQRDGRTLHQIPDLTMARWMNAEGMYMLARNGILHEFSEKGVHHA